MGRGLGSYLFVARARCVVLEVSGNGTPERFGGHGGGETPGPIPNPEVKPSSADGTARAAGWESRSPPRLFTNGATFGWRRSSVPGPIDLGTGDPSGRGVGWPARWDRSSRRGRRLGAGPGRTPTSGSPASTPPSSARSEEHTSELQSLAYLVCRLLLEKKKKNKPEHEQHSRQTNRTL